MPQYQVTKLSTCTITVEAEDEEQAQAIAEDAHDYEWYEWSMNVTDISKVNT